MKPAKAFTTHPACEEESGNEVDLKSSWPVFQSGAIDNSHNRLNSDPGDKIMTKIYDCRLKDHPEIFKIEMF